MMTLDQAIASVHDGRMTTNQFFRETRPVWARLAVYLLRRWPAPEWVLVEDVEQEVLIGAWRAIWDFDLARATGSHSQFVTWSAVDYGKKKLHKMRGAKLSGSADRNPSRNREINLSRFGEKADWILDLLHMPAPQHSHAESAQIRARVDSACVDERERAVISALAATEDMVAAALAIFENEYARKVCSIESPEHAGVLVVATATAVAQRLQVAA